jgi:urea transporter
MITLLLSHQTQGRIILVLQRSLGATMSYCLNAGTRTSSSSILYYSRGLLKSNSGNTLFSRHYKNSSGIAGTGQVLFPWPKKDDKNKQSCCDNNKSNHSSVVRAIQIKRYKSSTPKPPPPRKEPQQSSPLPSTRIPSLATATRLLNDDTSIVSQAAKGIGQVIFVNDPKAGLLVLGGLCLGDPYVGVLATLGTLTSTATASKYASGLDKNTLQQGLWSYNGCLVGCATAVFVAPTSILVGITATVAGAATSTYVAAALGSALNGRMPQWTYAFNVTTLTMLLYCQPLMVVMAAAPATSSGVDLLAAVHNMDVSTSMALALASPLKGISQIFVVEHAWTGAVITGATAYYYSPKLAQQLVLGSTVGTLTGACMGVAPTTELFMGLYGFNSALTAAAVGVFFVPTPQSMALSVGGAAATAVLFGGLKTGLGVLGVPALTLPFCICMSGCYLLADVVPGLTLAQHPHSPEQNTSSKNRNTNRNGDGDGDGGNV